ncbi:hypothetical protein JCGZ_26083 [Jatropha curcas]|uniref:Citrate transporter-like domain-containing protein n=1 Tax=Jatropha curcas TaxID=180498 RepID=A0A067JEL8_JATCU|nr:silicon efflux transporter LSI2 [Jatropha curcas]KDP22252.1 hypothetical protein JCGZ_26083 [Jatropha curcas]
MAATVKMILGSFAFAIFWVLAVFPAIPILPIGRTAGSLLAAVLMVIFQVITPTEAYSSIDISILALLFGTMVVSVYLERADAFKYLGKLLSWKSLGAKDLIFRVCLVSAITSAFFTNDTSCIVLTQMVLKIARQRNLPPHPFLLAIASSANIGSSATPIGNPQNLIIALNGDISFWPFLGGIFPAAVVGLLLNYGLLLCMYWKQLSSQKIEGNENAEITAEAEITYHRLNCQEICLGLDMQSSPYVLENLAALSNGVLERSSAASKWKALIWKSCVYLVTIGMLIALLMGVNISWTALTAALSLMVLDFKDAQPCLEKVSYSLLVFFCGLFMTITGFEKTGIPSYLWEFLEPYAHIDHASGITVLALIILILSNSISNVTTVLLLGGRVAASAASISPTYVKKAWLVLAWVSTASGNFTLVGSAANMIVCEQARNAPNFGCNLSFFGHLKFGLPSTILVTAIGLTLIH